MDVEEAPLPYFSAIFQFWQVSHSLAICSLNAYRPITISGRYTNASVAPAPRRSSVRGGAGVYEDGGRVDGQAAVGARLADRRSDERQRAPEVRVRREHEPPGHHADDGALEPLDHGHRADDRRIGAERAVITGQGHGVQRTGAPFNGRLERFLAADRAVEVTV